jgi:murein DD-endopeptidase MepM/ murein hydrolase activator NlpD
LDFNVSKYLSQAGGSLSTYRQYLMITGWTPSADVVARVALENSINPRLFLALLEHQSGCVLSPLQGDISFEYTLQATQYYRKDLYGQLIWAAHVLSEGYYGWLNGALDEFALSNGKIIRPDPALNAATVALGYFFAQLYDEEEWDQVLDATNGFPALYEEMFGNPWTRAQQTEPLLPTDLTQPTLTLPFETGRKWAYTGGPHRVFENNGPWAALDFAPSIEESGCYPSNAWVVAMSDGRVVRSEFGTVIQDLDDDGHEQTGWVLMYLHIEDRDRVPLGTYLQAGDRVGHPSCEGGHATGTHVHIARKYNGQWIPADGTIPFVLNGWTAHAGEIPYDGTLTKGDQTIIAHPYGSFETHIIRGED